MTKQELMSLPHLSISEEIPGMFIHMHTEEGYFITDYVDSKDIKEYNSTVCMYCPIMDTYNDYRIITKAEDIEYRKRQEEAWRTDEAKTHKL